MPSSVVAATELCKNQFDSDCKLGKEELLEVISTRDGGRADAGHLRAMDKTPHTLCKARIDGWMVKILLASALESAFSEVGGKMQRKE